MNARNRHYMLVVLDSSGGPTRRLRVSRQTLRLSGLVLGLIALVSLVSLVHATLNIEAAAETQRIARENIELSQLISRLENQLPAAHMTSLQAELSFAQLWAKSGLGLESKLLGVGPLEADESRPDEADKSAEIAASHDPTQIDKNNIPIFFARLKNSSIALQKNVGEMLEYFHDAQRLLSNTPSVRPTRTNRVSSAFGKRHDPLFGHWVMHKGLDIAGSIGLEIIAPADGVVIWTGTRGGYGKTVVIDHGYGLQTHYAHLSRFLVSPGDRIKRGDPIARMGSTGRSTGPHLHYEVRRNGQPLDPNRFILN